MAITYISKVFLKLLKSISFLILINVFIILGLGYLLKLKIPKEYGDLIVIMGCINIVLGGFSMLSQETDRYNTKYNDIYMCLGGKKTSDIQQGIYNMYQSFRIMITMALGGSSIIFIGILFSKW